MDITPLISSDSQVIQSYSSAGFKVSGQSYQSAICVCVSKTIEWPEANNKTISELSHSDFKPLIDRAQDIDVLLLGSGAKIAFLNSELRASLKQSGLNVEFMDTGAACRTYNVLMADGRRVVAALLPV